MNTYSEKELVWTTLIIRPIYSDNEAVEKLYAPFYALGFF